MESCSQRRWDGFTAVTVIERDWMGLWGRKVCDNLASKRDTESIPSQSSRTEITGLDQETHKTWDHSFHISARAPEFSCRESDKTLLLSEMSDIQYTVVPDIHTPCIYFRILQFYSSQDINNKKINSVSYKATFFITMPRPPLWDQTLFPPRRWLS